MKVTAITQEEQSYITQIKALEAEIFPDPWSQKSIEETLANPQAKIWAAVAPEGHTAHAQKSEVIGYVIFYYVMDEGEIARIAVAPDRRRQGVASELLRKMQEFSCEQGIFRWLLDVRASNENAIHFYENAGFARDGVRKNFYANPSEDAILMSCEAKKIIY